MSGELFSDLKKSAYYLKRNGLKATFDAVRERLGEKRQPPYAYREPSEDEKQRQRDFGKTVTEPLFSILVPAYNTPAEYLCALIDSVRNQTYPVWELLIADASGETTVSKVCAGYEEKRIRYIPLKENKGIAENSNQALAYAAGEYTCLLDHDDLLTPDALYEMVQVILEGRKKEAEVLLAYSDEDKCDDQGRVFFEPHIKEGFNLDLLLSNNYICHLLVMKTTLLKKLGFRSDYDGAQDYDLILRAVETILQMPKKGQHIGYVGKVLYHWRCHKGSTAENPRSKMYAYEAGRRALQDFADRMGYNAKAKHLPHLGFYRLQYEKDCFLCREDIGAIGGKLLYRGRIAGGRMDRAGKVYYEGLPVAYSGPMHKAALIQDALCVDIRCFRLRKELYPLFQEIAGIPYTAIEGTDIFDARKLPLDVDVQALSVALGQAIFKEGYLILWDPQMRKRL